MNRRWRVIIALIGLALVILATTALAYSLRPADTQQVEATLPAGLFEPDGGAP